MSGAASRGYVCVPMASESSSCNSDLGHRHSAFKAVAAASAAAPGAADLTASPAVPMLSKGSIAASSVGDIGRPRSLLSAEVWPVIDPNESRMLNFWDMFMAILLAITALLAPYESAFLQPQLDLLFVFDRVLDLGFLMDMVMQFFIAFANPRHPTHMVKEPRRIVKNYLGGWFWIDLISILPVDGYCVLSKQQCSSQFLGLKNLKIIRVLRLVRLLRLARYSNLVERWHTSFGFSYSMLSLTKFMIIILLCSHWMACLWGSLGMGVPGEHTWLTALHEAKGGPDDLYDDAFQVYTISLYWAIISLTSVGYGDIVPQTLTEYWVATLCASIMAAIWAYVIGAVCGIVSTMEPHEMSFKRTMDDLNWLMSDRGMPHEMCKKLRRYFHETREMSRRRVEREVIDQMSPMLQGEFAYFMHKKWLQKVWYLSKMPHEMIVLMSRSLNMAVYAPNEEVFSDRTLFIVRRGICALNGKILVSGDIWGEDMLLSNSFLRSKSQARSLSYLSVLKLHVEDVVEIVSNFPEARARLRWSQVQIAILRGVQMIAEVTNDLDRRGVLKSADLNDEERMDLFGDILQGRYANQEQIGDYFGADVETSHLKRREVRRHSISSAKAYCPSMASFATELDRRQSEELEDISGRVASLSNTLADLGQKVDKLLMVNLKSQSRSNIWADLGPLRMDSTSLRRGSTSQRLLLGNELNEVSARKSC